MGNILVIGSSNTDMVVKTNRFPLPGETIMGGDFYVFSGGKGANQAVAAARWGGQVTLVCKIGDDVFGQKAITGFNAEHIDTRFIKIAEQHASGVALILVNDSGENEIVVAPGANQTLSADEINDIQPVIERAEVILMQLEIPLPGIVNAARIAHHFDKKVILNPAPACMLPEELYGYLFLITPNETETELLTGIAIRKNEDLENAADIFLSRGVKNVIITLGASGAFYKSKGRSLMVASPKVEAVDTTAAGDVFNGVLAVELSKGEDWKAAITCACRAAAISVTRMGAQSSAPCYDEILNY